MSDYPYKIERLGRYEVACSACGAQATHRTGNALLGPEYGCGFHCDMHIPTATSFPLAVYRLDPPGIAGGDYPGTRLREDWPDSYRSHPDHPRNR